MDRAIYQMVSASLKEFISLSLVNPLLLENMFVILDHQWGGEGKRRDRERDRERGRERE